MSSESGQTSDASKPSSNLNEDKNWYVECSDEECYTRGGYVKGKMTNWQPDNPKDIVELFEAIDKNGAESVTLDLTCHARRPLTPSTESECSDSDEDTTKETSKANMDFDFDVDDDLNSTPTLAASRKALPGSAQRELKGSARKRTTDYKSILSNLDRQRKQDEAGKAAAAASTPNKN